MKQARVVGLLAIAVTALMAFAGSASATILTSPAGTTYTSTIKATSTETSLDGVFVTVTCAHSAVEGKVERHGASVTAEGKVNSLTFSSCNYPTTVKKAGSLEIHTQNEGGAANNNGTLTSTGAEIEIATSVGTCIFTTSIFTPDATDLGRVTGGTTAKFDITAATIRRTGGNILCGWEGEWTGSYTINTPDTLLVD